MTFRDLHTLEHYSSVVDLQRRIWGAEYADIVPAAIFAIVVKRGGILVGAFDEQDRMGAFVFSLPGLKHGRVMQWSHMLGVDEPFRRSGLGYRLKLAQRDRTLAQGLDLIEWTYDPLQAANAHLNFARLGVVAEEYLENVYGESDSILHRGTPTDRFVASWYVASPHVERRVAATPSTVPVRAASLANVPVVNPTRQEGEWLVCDGDPDTRHREPRLFVEIPVGFTAMQADAPEHASRWRLVTRDVFLSYFANGYRCVDFLLDVEQGRGRYLLQRADD